MLRQLSPVAFICCLTAVLATTTAPAADGPAPVFAADAIAETTLSLHGSTWVEDAAGHLLHVRYLNAGERQNYLQRMAGATSDPFASPPNAAPRFMTFLLRLENREDGEITIHSHKCWLTTNRNKVHMPLAMEELIASYGLVDRDLPVAYQHVGPAIMSGSWTLSPGESASGLLIYRAVHRKTKQFQVEVHFTRSDGDVVSKAAPYLRLKNKKKG